MAVTWLHLSDFHIRSGDPFDRDVVLRALVKSVAEYRERGRAPDVIFATGDIAYSGKPQEYELAARFFDDLLDAARLDKRRLFIIPGNHDVDRDQGIGLARTLASREQADSYFHPDRPKPHLTQKMAAFLDWHNRYLEGIRAAPSNSTCGPAELLEINGHRLGILPVNSALFGEGDDDHDKLWIGRRCLDAAVHDLRKLNAELNIALVHHPLEWLAASEASNIEAAFENAVHIMLRGHLHETRIESVASPEGRLLRCAAGACYQSRKWPNRALYAKFQDGRVTIFPIRYEDAPREIWTTDPSVFPRDSNHERTFDLPAFDVPSRAPAKPAPQPAPAPAPRFRSNIQARGDRPFVGRDGLVARIAAEFAGKPQEAVIVLHGHAGVGKSELAREFARQHRARYGGGTFWIDASTEAVAIHLAGIGKNILDLDFPPDLPLDDQGRRTFQSLGAAPTLLIYDNVVSFERLEPWLPLSGMPCHVVITTLLDAATSAWPCIEVPRLSPEQSMLLVEQVAGSEAAAKYGPAIVAHADGLPVQIVPEAATLVYEQRRGRVPSAAAGLQSATNISFRNAYQRLGQAARLLLQAAAILNPQRILRAELSRHMRDGLGWSEADFARALDTCLDLHLLEGTTDPGMHQLFAAFLTEAAISDEDRAALRKIRTAQRGRFLELAKTVSANPADTQKAAALIGYPATPEAWEAAREIFSASELDTAGEALSSIGRFAAARSWYKRAVKEKEKGVGDAHTDHESLGSSLHQVGYCLWSTGEFAKARRWFERAVEEKEKGDVHGRIDHGSLGRSLHMWERCLSSAGQFGEARPWYERAVAEKEKGDVHGRIDHDSLGRNLNLVGECLSSAGQFAEARPWYERAVAEHEKGDVHGRIDHAEVGKGLHQVGYCLSSAGQFAEARSWFERAVEEEEQGDVHGRIDHDSLGSSLYQLGWCLSSTGQFAEARPWYERAVEEKEKGDVYGRIDHDSLGTSLHEMGYCLSSTGQFAEARPWYERAVAEKEKGDVYGRIGHKSLSLTLRVGADCLRKLGDLDGAKEWERRASDENPQSQI